MITINDYIRWYEKEKETMLNSGMYASEPTFLFNNTHDGWDDEWVFNPDNWNGGDILRHGLLKILDNREEIDGYEIKYFCIEGQTTIFIFTSNYWYEITWYKNRGCTENIKMNGDPISLEDYINLCNSLNLQLE